MSRIKGDFQKGIIVFLLFTVVGLAVYWNAVDNPYEGDDALYVTENVNIRSLNNIPSFFTNPRMMASDPSLAGHYRPLVVLSYAVNYASGGLNPVIYHLTNLGFHILTAFLIFLILKALLESSVKAEPSRQMSYIAPLAAGLLFLVHPFNSEAVNYVTARSSVMSGFFYLLGFWCWINYRSQKLKVRSKISDEPVMSQGSQRRMKICCLSFVIPEVFNRESISPIETFGDDRNGFLDEQRQGFSNLLPLTSYFYLCSFLAFIAGMLSKEVVITLPLMLWLYDLYFQDIPQSAIRNPQLLNWRGYVYYLPFVLIVVIPYLVIRLYSYGGILPVTQRNIPTQIFTEAPVLVKYWRMFIIPTGLSLVHDIKINQFITGPVILSIGLLILFIGTAIYLLFSKEKYLKIISFFMFWFIIVLLPTTVVSLNSILQENRGYLAIISFTVIISIFLEMLNKGKRNKAVVALLSGLVLIYSIQSFYRNKTWDDAVILNKDAVSKAPENIIAYVGLAEAYMRNGEHFPAFEVARRGIAVEPNNFLMRVFLGMGYQYTNKNDEAIKEYKKALSLIPFHGDVWNELGKLYLQKDDIVHAEICFREGIKYGGSFTPLYYNLGKVLLKKKEYRNAIELLDRYIKLEPENVEARYDKANAFDAIGMTADAEREYREIIRLGSSAKATDKTKSNILEEAEKRLSGDKTIK